MIRLTQKFVRKPSAVMVRTTVWLLWVIPIYTQDRILR